ncbi:hypothetical protein CERZMDRAFT_81043 [Cercospora zeae-maydis SCOH1-5]|uniref:F-box domain-containing protein n=1 Tax=Cercospora zeae-maydis SCOH1-5 TaxID=717836 RepID=A0A6A6FUP8_9PEZI|nr:hypothetical protein CERZMDRAFT_81043 [Cercospora zeae-maydis SCOH1-5]
MSQARTRISFLDLPAEIRNDIYQRALVLERQVISVSGEHGRPLPRNLPPAMNILLANRQIYEEASSILYSENTWYANTEKEATTFLSTISRKNVARICRFELKYVAYCQYRLSMHHRDRWGIGSVQGFIRRSIHKHVVDLVRCTDGKALPLSLDAIHIHDRCTPAHYYPLSELDVWDVYGFNQWKWGVLYEMGIVAECPDRFIPSSFWP